MYNTVILQGRLTADPELKSTSTGKHVVQITIANEVGWGDKKATSFIPVTAWDGLAETISRLFNKGDLIGIEGRLKTRSWSDRDGTQRKQLELVATQFQFCDGGRKGERVLPQPDPTPAPQDFTTVESDEDLPF